MMMSILFRATLFLVLLAPVLAADVPRVRIDGNGVPSITLDGRALLDPADPAVLSVVLEDISRNAAGEKVRTYQRPDVKPTAASRQGHVLRQDYPWGRVEYAYTASPDALAIAVAIHNATSSTIADFTIRLATVELPGAAASLKPNETMACSLDNLAVVEAPCGGWKLLACCQTIEPPLFFGLGRPEKNTERYPLMVRGGVVAMEAGAFEFHPLGLPRVAPGKSLNLAFSLRFAPADKPSLQILADLHRAFREVHAPRLDWKDRRPIGQLFLPSGQNKSPANPRGWFGKADLNVSTPEGRAQFRKLMLDYADRSIKAMSKMDAQGMIVWNLEGEENPHPITYIGDPRMLRTLAPEMDEVADEFFARFRDAGFRTGCTLRPTQIYKHPEKGWQHGTGSDMPGRNEQFQHLKPADLPAWRFFPIVQRMCDKIDYARKRWGCTIFYIDTNGIFVPVGEKTEFKWRLLDALVLKGILEKHPDVLLIPELCRGDGTFRTAYWAYSAVYFELDYGGIWTTPGRVLDIMPGAFSVIALKDAKNYDARRADLVEAVRRGDILFFRGWFDDSINPKIRSIYEDAGRLPRK